MKKVWFSAVLVLAALALTACGGGADAVAIPYTVTNCVF